MIRKATMSDIKPISRLWTNVSKSEFSHYIGEDNIQYFIENGELDKEVINQLPNTYVLAKSDEILGFVVLIENLLELLIVSPTHQNGFIGKKLYDFSIQQISQKHDTTIAECFEKNTRANTMLQRLGFELIKTYQEDMGFQTHTYSKSIRAS